MVSIGINDTPSGIFVFSSSDFFGTRIVSKPSRYDSLILFCRLPIVRISPERPISPIASTFSGIGTSLIDEIKESAIARSTLGSSRRKPLTTLT